MTKQFVMLEDHIEQSSSRSFKITNGGSNA